MKKLATLLFLSTALVAGSAQAHKHKNHHHNKPCKTEKRHVANSGARTHWLAGVSAGYAWRSGNVGYDSGFNQATPLVDIATAGDLKTDSFLYGVFAGIQTVCNRWILGAEFAIDWQPRHEDNTFGFDRPSVGGAPAFGTGVVTANLERDTNFTLSTRLGYALGWYNLIPYARLGVETSRDYLKARTDLLNPVIIDPGTIAYLQGNERSYRLVAGAGIEMPFTFINSGTSLRVEYNYHASGAGVTANDFTHIAGINDVVQTAQVKQHANSVRASLAYNFL